MSALADEPAQDLGALRLLQVDDEALLVAVDAEEIVALAGDEGREMPGLVAAAGRLDLQHLGAEIAEALGAERPGQHPRQIDDPEPVERPGPGACSIGCSVVRFRRTPCRTCRAPALKSPAQRRGWP